MEGGIPIIDFGAYGLGIKDTSGVSAGTITSLAEAVTKALQDAGCFYLKNHGLDEALIAEYNTVSRHFFEQSDEVKKPYARHGVTNFGWMGIETEGLDPDAPMDFKECFNYCPPNDAVTWTIEKTFPEINKKLFNEFTNLANRIGDVFSVVMGQDVGFLRQCQGLVGKPGNQTTLRPSYYHPIPAEQELKEGQMRCGTHTDFDTYSIIVQDDVGGMEAELPGRGFVPVTPVPGLAFVNIGGVMQRLTAGKLQATNHRIVVGGADTRARLRQSVAYYITPDDEFVIKCLDGSDAYPPMSYKDFLAVHFKKVLY